LIISLDDKKFHQFASDEIITSYNLDEENFLSPMKNIFLILFEKYD